MASSAGPLPRRSIWIAQAVSIVGLLIYVLAVRLVAPSLQRGGGPASVQVGLVLALVPAVLWLILFYVNDAREPEPLGEVLPVAVVGGIAAAALAVPVVRAISGSAALVAAGPIPALLVSILIAGAVQEFCKYLAVRYVVYDTPEFDEVADGVTYGTAAGLGVATTLSLWFVISSPSINPVPAALRIVVTALAHAAFGGVLGYFLGRAKIYRETSRVVLGFLIAVVLNGIVTFTLREVTSSGLAYRPWNSLVVAAVVSVAVTLILLRQERRAEAAPA